MRLWHNPRCSKSRAAKALLEERGASFDIYRYLDTPPDAAALDKVLTSLGIDAAALLRTGEAAWKSSGLSKGSPEAEIRALILANPILIERPILESASAAAIGRPPEAILKLL